MGDYVEIKQFFTIFYFYVIRYSLKGNPFFHSDEQLELDLENDYPDKTEHNLKSNTSISVLKIVSDSA